MKILVAVIAHNEELNIKGVLAALEEHSRLYDFIVVDDGSTDKTSEICREAGFVVLSHCVNSGSFGAVKTYFLYAFKNGYDILCQFDGDGQHLASELPKIIGPIDRHEADYVIGSRFLEVEGFQSSFIRRIGIRLFCGLLSLMIGQKITDSTSGFRGYSRKVIESFAEKCPHEIHDTIQMLLLTHSTGGKIVEVPVLMRDRKHGVSEFNSISSVVFLIKGLVSVLVSSVQRSKIGR